MKFLKFSETLEFISESTDDTIHIGEITGHFLTGGVLILLKGTLGMGKTHFVKGIGKALECGRIKSPTFILTSEHSGKIPLLHADLYRLENENEIDSLDLCQYLDDGWVVAVEWAEKWRTPDAQDILEVNIIPVSENERKFIISAASEQTKIILRNIAESIKS